MQQSISLESNFVESLKLEFDKEMFNQRFEDIQNGNAVLLSQDDYQNKMSSFVKELETKYADS